MVLYLSAWRTGMNTGDRTMASIEDIYSGTRSGNSEYMKRKKSNQVGSGICKGFAEIRNRIMENPYSDMDRRQDQRTSNKSHRRHETWQHENEAYETINTRYILSSSPSPPISLLFLELPQPNTLFPPMSGTLIPPRSTPRTIFHCLFLLLLFFLVPAHLLFM